LKGRLKNLNSFEVMNLFFETLLFNFAIPSKQKLVHVKLCHHMMIFLQNLAAYSSFQKEIEKWYFDKQRRFFHERQQKIIIYFLSGMKNYYTKLCHLHFLSMMHNIL